MKDMIKSPGGLILNPRTQVHLKKSEIAFLKAYIKTRGSIKTIRTNTGISPDTLHLGLERGTFEAPSAMDLRLFIKKLKALKLFEYAESV